MPGIEQISLADFSGGFVPRRTSTDFSERQWAKLHGFVLEDEARIRSQWALQQVGADSGFDELDTLDARVIARKPDGTFWYEGYVPSTETFDVTRARTWTQITGITADTELHIVCRVPLRDEDAAGFREGLLLNGRERAGSAYAVYFDGGGNVQVKEWTKKWPDGTEGTTDNMMPPANKGAMWGDFLVLGDIRWFDDDTAVMSDTNNKPFPNGLWFSEGGDVDQYDPLSVEFLNFGTGPDGQDVAAMVNIDAGLLALSASGVVLLRGDGYSHARELIRAGVGPADQLAAAWWPEVGAAAMLDKVGQVWLTNGEEFTNLTKHLDVDRSVGADDWVYGWQEFLLVHREGRLLAFRAFDVDGAWTELIPPAGVTSMSWPVHLGDQLYFLDDAGTCWRFNRRDDIGERGLSDGLVVSPSLATRTVERFDGHEQTWWHRFGVYGRGYTGVSKVSAVTLYDGPVLDPASNSLTRTLNDVMGERHRQIVRAHGPSVEASAEVTFEGDVEVEQAAWWAHRGRTER